MADPLPPHPSAHRLHAEGFTAHAAPLELSDLDPGTHELFVAVKR